MKKTKDLMVYQRLIEQLDDLFEYNKNDNKNKKDENNCNINRTGDNNSSNCSTTHNKRK